MSGQLLTDILALHETILDGAGETLTSLLLVTVIKSSIEQTITLLNRFVDGLHIR